MCCLRIPTASVGLPIRHRALGSAADDTGVFRQYSARGIRAMRTPLALTPLEFSGRQIDVYAPSSCINRHQITIAEQSDRAAQRRLGRNMSNHKTVTAPREAPIRNQCNLGAETASDNGTCRTEHLAHSRAAFGALVTNHDDITRPHLVAKYGLRGRLFTVECAHAASKGLAFFAADLGYRTFRSNISI